MDYLKVADYEDLWPGEMRGVEAGGRRILLVHHRSGISAFEDRCCHLGLPLSRGEFGGDVLRCFAHHWEYDPVTGAGINPRNVCLVRFPVKVQDGEILVDPSAPEKDL